MLRINELERLYLGVQQENEARTLFIDMSAWTQNNPNATVEILHKRQGDETKYLTAATYDSETMLLSWTPTEYDTFYEGFGIAEIRMKVGNVVRKTKDLLVTAVSPSLIDGTGATIASDYQAWLDNVISTKNAAVTAKEAAEGFKADAEAWAKGTRAGTDVESTDPAYHNNSKYYAEQAAALIDVSDVAGALAETLNPGSQATAQIVTTEDGKKFLFGIPKGEPGDNGVFGIKMNGSLVQLDSDQIANLGSVVTDKSDKADKVTGGTENNFAALDANGNLKDSGHKHSDYLTEHQDISGKADKVTGSTNGNFAGLDANGNLTDSGSKASDFLTEHQDISGKANKDIIAIVENGDNATQNITEGSYVVWKGVLKKASAAIASGDALSSSNLSAVSNGLGGEVASLNGKLNNYNALTSTATTNAVSGVFTQVGRVVTCTGHHTCKNATMESIPTNLPAPLGMFGITARDASSGALVQMYVGANGNINNYNHTGTMTVGNEYYWSFSYITAS